MRTALAQPRPTTAPHLRPLATQHPSKNNTAHYKANPPHPNPGSAKSRPIPGFRTNPGFTSPLSNPAVTGPNHTPPKYPLTPIANSNTLISHCNMRLGEKIRYLREVEGALRGLDRAMTQLEIAHAINEELKKPFSQSYLSQIESGARPHLTNTSRMLLAKFFKVHPGYLVDDPEGYSTELISDLGALEDRLDLWLVGGAERFRKDPGVCEALLALAKHPESRRCLTLLKLILENPGLADRLFDVLKPKENM